MTTLRIAMEKVDLLPPTRVTDDTSILTLKSLVFEPLLRWQDGFAKPGLFHHWHHTPDGRQWRFFIRPGAVFHDGKPCVAQDVLDFIAAILTSVDMFGMKWSYSRYLAHARFSAGPDNSVVFDNPEPMADILDIFSEFFLARLDADGIASLGTGPYRVAAFEAGRSLTLERVHAGSGPERIVADAHPSAAERLRRLQAGDVDVALNLERDEAVPTRDPAFVWGEAVTTMSVIAYLNCFEGLFASPLARLAVNLAVDTDAIIREVMHGLAVPAATIVSPFHLGMRGIALRPLDYDPDRARALFDGIGGPSTLRLRTPTFMPDHAPAISQSIAEYLERVGFRVMIETEPDRPDYARQIGRKETGDLALFDSSPHSTFRVLDDKISSASRGVWWQGYDDAEAQTLIARANRAVGDDARESAYAACLKHLHAHPPWLYLFHPISVFAARPGVKPLRLDHKGVLVLTTMADTQ